MRATRLVAFSLALALVPATASAIRGAVPATASAAREDAPGRASVSAVPDPAALASAIAAPWPELQRADDGFRDYMEVRPSPPRDKYGDAALGYALLQTGTRTGDARLIDSGLRALVRSAERVESSHSLAFEQAALAAGYNLARRTVPAHPVFVAAQKRLERRLKTMRPVRLGHDERYFNQFLVDALAILELERTGLESSEPGTILHDRGASVGLVEALVNRELLAYTRGQTSRAGRAGLTTLATDGPLAYHALTLAYTARAIRLLEGRASPASRQLVQRYARATWAFMGPDGDVTYFGRSQQQSWVLAMTAYGMELAAQDADSTWAPRFRAVSERALVRLAALHLGGPFGLHLTPAFQADLGVAATAQDDYVAGPAYTGLTVTGLEWLAEARRPGPAGGLAADAPLAFRLGAGGGAFAVVSTGRLWYVVRQRPGVLADLRSGSGLVALKVRDASGAWRNALPQRPITVVPRTRGGEDSAGPVLKLAGAAGLPYGRALRVAPRASVRWLVDFRRPGFGRLLRRATVTLQPSRCGVRMLVPARAGDRHEVSVFLPARPRPRRAGALALVGGGLRAARSKGPGAIAMGRTYFNATEGRLVRARLSARSPRRGTVGFTFGSRSACPPR